MTIETDHADWRREQPVIEMHTHIGVDHLEEAIELMDRNGLETMVDISAYSGETFVQLFPWNDQSQLDEGFLKPTACNGTNRCELFVFSADNGLIMLVARLDNLGKGASGAAVQNMNVRLGLDETTGLL